MTETGNQQTEHLQVVSEPVHLAGLEHGEHGLADVEGVAPVVVLDRAVVLLDTEGPSADHLPETQESDSIPKVPPQTSGMKSNVMLLMQFPRSGA